MQGQSRRASADSTRNLEARNNNNLLHDGQRVIDIEIPQSMNYGKYLPQEQQNLQGDRESSDDIIRVKQEVREEEADDSKFAVAAN